MNSSTRPSGDAQSFLSGKLAHVDVAGIERELKQLWKQASEAGSKESSVMRACSFNIVVVSRDDNAEQVCSDLLDELLQARPGRGILAIYRPDLPHKLDAWVSARCHLEGSSKQICSEQITVCCEGGYPKELASVVTPLLIADLPVFLYWRGALGESEAYRTLSHGAGRLVVDSLRDPFDLSQLKRAAQIIEADHIWMSDLNWRRLSGWMRAFADAFDGFPMPVEYVYKFKKLTIASVPDQAASKQNPVSTQSMLLVGWLASRLGWLPAGKLGAGDTSLSFKDKNGQPVTVEFTTGQGQATGHVVSAECEFADGKRMRVASETSDEMSFVVAHAEGCDHKEATRADYDLNEAALLAQEVANLGGFPLYEASIKLLAQVQS